MDFKMQDQKYKSKKLQAPFVRKLTALIELGDRRCSFFKDGTALLFETPQKIAAEVLPKVCPVLIMREVIIRGRVRGG